jgi:hypothetical protein
MARRSIPGWIPISKIARIYPFSREALAEMVRRGSVRILFNQHDLMQFQLGITPDASLSKLIVSSSLLEWVAVDMPGCPDHERQFVVDLLLEGEPSVRILVNQGDLAYALMLTAEMALRNNPDTPWALAPEWLTIRDAALLSGMDEATIQHLAETGEIETRASDGWIWKPSLGRWIQDFAEASIGYRSVLVRGKPTYAVSGIEAPLPFYQGPFQEK